jgi:hypothetical protein
MRKTFIFILLVIVSLAEVFPQGKKKDPPQFKVGRHQLQKTGVGIPKFDPFYSPGKKYCIAIQDTGFDWCKIIIYDKVSKQHRYLEKHLITFSENGHKVAYVVGVPHTDKKRVYVNHQPVGESFEQITSVHLSPTGTRIIYFTKTGNLMFPVINGKVGDPFEQLIIKPVFTYDGKQYAFAIKDRGKQYAIVNKMKIGPFGEIKKLFLLRTKKLSGCYAMDKNKHVMMFGKQRKEYDTIEILFQSENRFIYKARYKNKHAIVVNGVEQNWYDEITDVKIGKDAKHIFYLAYDENRYFLCLNGNEYECKSQPRAYCISPDFQNFALSGIYKDNFYVVLNGKVLHECKDKIERIAFTPKNQLVGVINKKGGQCIFIDKHIGKKYAKIEDIIFAKGRVAYKVLQETKDGRRYRMVIDGKESRQYIQIGSFSFTSDGTSYILVGQLKDKTGIEVDGKKPMVFEKISHLIFTPDGRKFAFIGTSYIDVEKKVGGKRVKIKEKKQAVYIQGKCQKYYDYIVDVKFGPFSKNIAYIAQSRGKMKVVFNGKERRAYDAISNLYFVKGGRDVVYTAVDSEHSYLVTSRGHILCDSVRKIAHTPLTGHLLQEVSIKHRTLVVFDGKQLGYGVVKDKIISPDEKHIIFTITRQPEQPRRRYTPGVGPPQRFATWKEMFVNGSRIGRYLRIDGLHFSPTCKKVAFYSCSMEKGLRGITYYLYFVVHKLER